MSTFFSTFKSVLQTAGHLSEPRFFAVWNTQLSIPNEKSRRFPRNSAIPLFYVYDCRSLDIRASHNNYLNKVHHKLSNALPCTVYLSMRYMYISSGCFVCVSVYEIQIYIYVYIFCLCVRYMYISYGCFVYVWDTCIYNLGVLSVYTNVYLWDTCLYYLDALSDFPVSRPLLYIYLLLLQCFCLNCLFFSKKKKIASLFRISSLSCDFPCLERPLHGRNIADTA